MENIAKQLEIIGISGKDTEIYLELLRLREATVIQLSKQTKIKRTSVYYCLDSLIEKNLISLSIKNGKKLYYPEDPKQSLSSLVEQKKSAVEQLLPQIKNIYGSGSDHPAIKVYYNLNGIKNIFEDVLSCKEKVARYYVSDLNIDELLGEAFLKSFVKRRVTGKIKSLSLRTTNYTPGREKSENQLRETRIIPEGLSFAPYMCIYDNKSVIISAKEKIGFIVESQEFANAQKALFDFVWKNSKTKDEIFNEDKNLKNQKPQKATEEDIYY